MRLFRSHQSSATFPYGRMSASVDPSSYAYDDEVIEEYYEEEILDETEYEEEIIEEEVVEEYEEEVVGESDEEADEHEDDDDDDDDSSNPYVADDSSDDSSAPPSLASNIPMHLTEIQNAAASEGARKAMEEEAAREEERHRAEEEKKRTKELQEIARQNLVAEIQKVEGVKTWPKTPRSQNPGDLDKRKKALAELRRQAAREQLARNNDAISRASQSVSSAGLMEVSDHMKETTHISNTFNQDNLSPSKEHNLRPSLVRQPIIDGAYVNKEQPSIEALGIPTPGSDDFDDNTSEMSEHSIGNSDDSLEEEAAQQESEDHKLGVDTNGDPKSRPEHEKATARSAAELLALENERLKAGEETKRREKESGNAPKDEDEEEADTEKVETETLEAERLANERLEAEKREAERLEREKAQPVEAERLEAVRVESERIEAERVENERLQAEKQKAERLEAERLEAERLEKERLEVERLEKERLKAEKQEAERVEAERLEAVRLEEERIENERLLEAERARHEAERIETERREADHRREQEILEAQRIEKEKLKREEDARLRAEEAQSKAEQPESQPNKQPTSSAAKRLSSPKAQAAANRFAKKAVDTSALPAAFQISVRKSAADKNKAYEMPENWDGQYYSVDDLKQQKISGLDYTKREAYLSPADFEGLFQMTKEEFAKLPKWKRDKAKTSAGMF